MLAFAMLLVACDKNGNEVSPTNPPVDAPSDAPTTAPEDKPTGAPTDTPAAPTDVPATPTPVLPDVTPDDFDPIDFLGDCVWCGDSVLAHYEWKGPYCREELFGKFSQSNWLVSISNAARLAVSDEGHAEEPVYKGETAKLWKVIPQLEKSRVMMFFGLNDIGPTGVDKFMENYDALINKVLAAAPDVKIYLMSLTPVLEGKEVFHDDGSGLNNVNVMEANRRIEAYAKEKGFGFIDVATPFRNENNAMKPEYSDGTNVHIRLDYADKNKKLFSTDDYNVAPYLIWDDILVQYAKEQLMEEYLDTFR